MMAEATTYESMLDEVNQQRQRDPRVPIAIRLGQEQRKVIEQHIQSVTGTRDIGPLTSFAGLDLAGSRASDKLELVYAEDDAPPPEPVGSGPEAAPAEATPSAG